MKRLLGWLFGREEHVSPAYLEMLRRAETDDMPEAACVRPPRRGESATRAYVRVMVRE